MLILKSLLFFRLSSPLPGKCSVSSSLTPSPSIASSSSSVPPTNHSAASHRVHFNDKNEVASQDTDGSFTVTYRDLGEKIVTSQTSVTTATRTKTPGLKVQFGETSCVETVDMPQFRLTEHARNVTFDEDSLQSYKK